MSLLCFHIWHVVRNEVDPMELHGTFSNYINVVFACQCVKCGKQKKYKHTVQFTDDSQTLMNRRAAAQAKGMIV